MLRAITILLFIISFQSCRTAGSKGSDLLLAPETSPASGTVVSNEAKCEANGGEFISGYCVCEDGTTVNGKTCGQYIKDSYPDCFAKGGISKKWDGKNVCMCEHGEIINPKSSAKTCYELFTEKNRGCAVKLGILGVKDRACTCLHGTLTFNLPSGQSCQDDFKAKNPICFEKGGVTKTDGGPCICRDGTYAEGTEKCAEPWFFYAGNRSLDSTGSAAAGSQSAGSTGSSAQQNDIGNGSRIGQSNTKCLCSHVFWQNADYCLIHKVGERNALQYSKIDGPSECTLNHCYTHFQKSYQDVCGGNVSLLPSKNQVGSGSSGSSSTQGGNVCECKDDQLYGQRACGLFQNGVRRFSVQDSSSSCNADFCRGRWGYDPYVRQYCSGGIK